MDIPYRWLDEPRRAVAKFARYYFLFSKPLLFLLGLVTAHVLVEYAVVVLLIQYLTSSWENGNLAKAVAVINAQDGLSLVLSVVVTHLADTRLGRFKMVSVSTTCYAAGFTILWLLDPANKLGIYMIAGVLIAVGRASKDPPLRDFLTDQLRIKDPSHTTDTSKLDSRANFWWRLARVVGAAIGALALANLSSKVSFMVSTIVMGSALLIFLSGFYFYQHDEPLGPGKSPVSTIYRVILMALQKRRVHYSDNPRDYYGNETDAKLPLVPSISLLRWLDKAAMMNTISAEDHQGQVCMVKEVKSVKLLFRMVPMWATFVVYCLVSATGATLFYEQTTNMKGVVIYVGFNFTVPDIIFYMIKKLTKFAISVAYNLLIPKSFSMDQRNLATKIRIGAGLISSILCCVVAMLVEKKRLHKVMEHELADDTDTAMDMSMFYLTAQFCLLGIAEGLAEDGLSDFFDNQVTEPLRSYEQPFNYFILGMGKAVSMVWLLIFRRYFGDTINHSRLDIYYLTITLLSTVNLGLYFIVSSFFYRKAIQVKVDEDLKRQTEEDNDDVTELGGNMEQVLTAFQSITF